MSTKSSTPEGKDSALINDSSGEVIFNPQHHFSQHPLYVDNDLEVSPSKNPKGAYDAEGDGPLQNLNHHPRIIIFETNFTTRNQKCLFRNNRNLL